MLQNLSFRAVFDINNLDKTVLAWLLCVHEIRWSGIKRRNKEEVINKNHAARDQVALAPVVHVHVSVGVYECVSNSNSE